MEQSTLPYPPAPWTLGGRAWVGLFRSDEPVPAPAGLRSVFGSRWLAVILARYLVGTLRYNELVIGPPVRCGLRIGVWVAGIWVDDEASYHAGRQIWGLPKELAEFQWDNDGVRICDRQGLITVLRFGRGRIGICPVLVPAVGVGRIEGRFARTTARVCARLGTTRLRVDEWSQRFSYRPRTKPVFGAAVRSFRMTVPAPRLMDKSPGEEQLREDV